ncbi:MAG: diphthamide synthesis protein, partial [Candidatus Bathyarchaeota archaeon]
MSFDFEENRLKRELAKQAPKIVLLQLPEGLKPQAPFLTKIVEQAGALPIVSSDPCYGACDLAVSEAKLLGADLIVHYGHTSMIENSEIPTVYLEAPIKLEINELITKALPLLEE